MSAPETLILNGPLAANINFNTEDVLMATTVTGSGYSLANGSGMASNYALTSTSATAAANITPRDVSITGTIADDKVYDGDTLATLSNIGTVTTGVGTETLSLNGPLAANINFNTKDVLTATTVTGSGYSLADGSGMASNYALTSTSATPTANIMPRDVSITGTIADDKVYDGDTLATLSNIGTVTTGVGTETLSLNGPLAANINFNDPNVLTANTVTASGYSLADDTGLASNYALTSTSATAAASITPKDVTIAGTVANDKLYDGNTLATLFNIGTVTTGVGTQTLVLNGPLAANINFNDKDVLDANLVTASGYSLADDGSFLASNYALTSTSTTATANIMPRDVSITGTIADDKVYDGGTLATLFNIGAVSTGVGSETLVLNGPLAANFNDPNVLTANTVTASGYSLADDTGLASNYALTSTSATAAANITQEP